ncbi:hypothetical protein FQN60_007965, partial [Etheostoma spectabile]
MCSGVKALDSCDTAMRSSFCLNVVRTEEIISGLAKTRKVTNGHANTQNTFEAILIRINSIAAVPGEEIEAVQVIVSLCGGVKMRNHTSGANVEERLRQSHMELQWIQRQLATIAAKNLHHHHLHTKGKTRFEVSSQQTTAQSVYNVNRFRLLEERNRALKLEVATLRQEKQQYRKL